MPWKPTPAQRHLLEQHGSPRPVVTPPMPDTGTLDGSHRVGGHALGDLLALSALDDLADRGNPVAADMALRLRRLMGLVT